MFKAASQSTVFLFRLLLFFRDLLVCFLELEGVRVKLVDIEIVFLCKEAVDSNSEESCGFLPVLFKVGRKHLENVCVAVDIACHLIGYFINEGEPFIFCLDLIKFDIFNFLDHEVIYFYELVDDAGVLELKHNLYEFP
jgi:hypothetical protein